MLSVKAPFDQVMNFVDGILVKLNKAEELLSGHATTTGVIDEIRSKLLDMFSL